MNFCAENEFRLSIFSPGTTDTFTNKRKNLLKYPNTLAVPLNGQTKSRNRSKKVLPIAYGNVAQLHDFYIRNFQTA